MGACQSKADNEEEEKKKRSRAIDAKLEEDSRRLRKECKILLLGKLPHFSLDIQHCEDTDVIQAPAKAANQPSSSK